MPPLLAFSDSDKLDLGQRAQRQEREGAEMNAAEGSQKDPVCSKQVSCLTALEKFGLEKEGNKIEVQKNSNKNIKNV